MILIVCAMPSEASEITKQLHMISEYPFPLYSGKLAKKDVVLIISGIGKTNAASALTFALFLYREVKLIINAGIAGGYKVEKYGTYLIEEATYHDVDVTAFSYEYGQIPNFPTWYQSEVSVLNKIADLKQERLYTGDRFSTKPLLEEPYLVDMEGAAIYQVGHRFKHPVISVKVVSDLIGDTKQIEGYVAEEKDFAGSLLEAVLKLLEVS